MGLTREGLEARATYSWLEAPIHVQLCNGNWQPTTATAANIIDSEVLDNRVLVSNISLSWDTVTAKNVTTMTVVVTPPTTVSFNRVGLIRDGHLVSKYNGTFTSTTTINLSTSHTFTTGTRIIYSGVAYTITGVSGSIITIGTPSFPASGTGFIRSGKGKQLAGLILSTTRNIQSSASATFTFTGDNYAL